MADLFKKPHDHNSAKNARMEKLRESIMLKNSMGLADDPNDLIAGQECLM